MTPEFSEGPIRIFVPVVKHPRDFALSFGPLGYEEVEEIEESPLTVNATGIRYYAEEKE